MNYPEARRLLARHAKLVEPSAESLWLALRVERRLGQRTTELSYANQLRRRFPASRKRRRCSAASMSDAVLRRSPTRARRRA